MHLSTNPLPRPPEISPKTKAVRCRQGRQDADVCRRGRAPALDPPAGPPPAPSPAGFHTLYPPQPNLSRSYSYSQRYRPASSENIAAAAQVAARRHAEEMRRYHEHLEEIRYRERQAARATREGREAFEGECERLGKQRRKTEERRKNGEKVIVAAWAH
ncbi:hypothetical protein FS749_008195 [Ceratobasidium sp. UAMH 11750]|nr:hypothetical protein FS749_008195 [Ceratobasidium sp. UAMH 11750]